jgi:hypothetical protein
MNPVVVADNPTGVLAPIAPSSILPFVEVIPPPEKRSSPPINAKVSPIPTRNPLARLTIALGFVPNCNPIGALIVSREPFCGLVALKVVRSSKRIFSAVVARKEPPMLREALSPKRIPLGLSRNRLAVPLVRISPLMVERSLPVTRAKMLAIAPMFLNKAVPLSGTENS